MSANNTKIILAALTVINQGGVLRWEGNYKFSAPVSVANGSVNDGSAYVDVAGHTESEVRALMAQAAVEHANQETSNVENFELTDVIGGAI